MPAAGHQVVEVRADLDVDVIIRPVLANLDNTLTEHH